MFRWAVVEEFVPRDLAHALEAVEHLKRAEYGVAEGRKIGPVAEAHMRAVLPHVARQVAAMIELQWWAGMRPGEAAQLRPADLERTDKLWIYRSTTRPSTTASRRKGGLLERDPLLAQLLRLLPGVETVNGIATTGDHRAAWFKDPSGNVLSLHQGRESGG